MERKMMEISGMCVRYIERNFSALLITKFDTGKIVDMKYSSVYHNCCYNHFYFRGTDVNVKIYGYGVNKIVSSE